MLEHDARPERFLRETHLDLARLLRVRLRCAIERDLPAEHDPSRRLPDEDAPPVAFEVVRPALEGRAAKPRLDADGLQDVLRPGVLAWPPAAQIHECRERPSRRNAHEQLAGECVLIGRLHRTTVPLAAGAPTITGSGSRPRH